jgi:16S rRNA (uracil1498-N3)-methyltransferase
MAQRPPVFVAGLADLAAEQIVLAGAEGRHASTVRRLVPGERADVTDGAGTLAECVVTSAGPGSLNLTVLSRRCVPRPQPSVAVVQALIKGERAEHAVDLLAQVGADVVLPWAAERSIVQWRAERSAKSLARWRSAAHEAAKQSRRAWFPEVTEPVSLTTVADRIKAAALAVLLDPEAATPLAQVPIPLVGEVVLVVGPEGGITEAEAEALAAAGCCAARLGPTVLRAESAGAVATGIVLAGTARWA